MTEIRKEPEQPTENKVDTLTKAYKQQDKLYDEYLDLRYGRVNERKEHIFDSINEKAATSKLETTCKSREKTMRF